MVTEYGVRRFLYFSRERSIVKIVLELFNQLAADYANWPRITPIGIKKKQLSLKCPSKALLLLFVVRCLC